MMFCDVTTRGPFACSLAMGLPVEAVRKCRTLQLSAFNNLLLSHSPPIPKPPVKSERLQMGQAAVTGGNRLSFAPPVMPWRSQVPGTIVVGHTKSSQSASTLSVVRRSSITSSTALKYQSVAASPVSVSMAPASLVTLIFAFREAADVPTPERRLRTRLA